MVYNCTQLSPMQSKVAISGAPQGPTLTCKATTALHFISGLPSINLILRGT